MLTPVQAMREHSECALIAEQRSQADEQAKEAAQAALRAMVSAAKEQVIVDVIRGPLPPGVLADVESFSDQDDAAAPDFVSSNLCPKFCMIMHVRSSCLDICMRLYGRYAGVYR